MAMKRPLQIGVGILVMAGVVWAQGREAEFRKLALQLVAQRQAGGVEKEEPQTQALALLDEVATAALNERPATQNASKLPSLNLVLERLHGLTSAESRIGESYTVQQIGAESAATGAPLYAVAANFGLSGPSAVRLYAPTSLEAMGSSQAWLAFKLVAKIDRFTNEEFFDEYLEVVPVNPQANVFVTVTGRTDDRKTGLFMAWRFDGEQLKNLWTSELLEHSAYEAKDGAFRLDFCAEPDEDKPSQCKKMQHDQFRWNGNWSRKPAEDSIPKTRNQ